MEGVVEGFGVRFRGRALQGARSVKMRSLDARGRAVRRRPDPLGGLLAASSWLRESSRALEGVP
ncbi:hypothetical protein STXM2123_2959 [Streptomyces sp. F-3]|jgi:hypothetical protein|nr:hypothetical protein STXM2123_2959 [Streptomyces sp. F-3]